MDDSIPIPVVGRMSPGWEDFFIVMGVLLVVVIIAFIWVAFFRKASRRTRRSHRHSHHRMSYGQQIRKGATELKEFARKHKERRRRQRNPVNPTLAETGGLPPVRTSDTPSPPSLPQPPA